MIALAICYNHLPKEEGIETQNVYRIVWLASCYNHLPKEEGIETLASQTQLGEMSCVTTICPKKRALNPPSSQSIGAT